MTDDAPTPDAPGTTTAAQDRAIAAQVREVGTAMLRGGLVPGAVAGLVAVVVATVVGGGAGLATALGGALIALAVCALGPLVMRWTSSADPMVVMGIAMISFVTKVGVLAVLLIVLDRLGVVDTRLLALALGLTALAFLAGETVAFARARIPTIAAA